MSQRISRFVALFVVAVFWLPVATGRGEPVVPSYQRFFAADGGKTPEPGWLLAGELGCAACHHAQAVPQITAKQAPILAGVAGRVRPDHLLKFIAKPQQVKPGTTMPNLFEGKTDRELHDLVLPLVHYLVSLGGGPPEQAYASAGGRIRGEQLYHQVGCVACHGPRRKAAKSPKSAKPLGDLGHKYTVVSLASFLLDPHKVRPSGRMPSLNLSSRDANDLAAYLLPDVPAKSGISWEMFKGRFDRLPDFSKLKPAATGDSEVIGIGVTKERDGFCLVFEGVLPIDKDGEYTFYTNSDDGSKLYIDDKVVVDNDGVHGSKVVSGKIQLKPGRYRVRVEFFERDGGELIHAEYEGPGIKRQKVDSVLLSAAPETELEDLSFQVDPQLAAKGRELFQTTGCASCHQLKERGETVVSRVQSEPFAGLRARGGCLDAKPRASLPHYHLSVSQRKALAPALVQNLKKRAPQTQSQKVAHTMATFNCYACHQRGELGGVEQESLPFFTTTQPEMGVEGSVPPHLNGIAAKLTRDWLDGILANGATDRPYMNTKMPKFGKTNIGVLGDLLEDIDVGEPPPDLVELKPTREVKMAGWEMIGVKGFSCIKCHTFGRFKATGVQSIDMTVMHKRLRETWFRGYLRDPQAYRPGTRMPSSWPPTLDKSLLPKILDGDIDKQIKAVWLYLGDGSRARTPLGLVNNSMELIPTHEAMIYRNFIQGGGPRAIGVGYPEAINLAFDANDLRLALIWQGAFIDAKRHWVGRGQGFQPPAGQKVQKLAAGVAFATLDKADADWPTAPARELGHRFRGYRLTEDRRPTFLYQIHDYTIEDFPNPVERGVRTYLTRRIRVIGGRPDKTLYFRAATGSIEPLGDRKYRVGDLTITLTSPLAPLIHNNELRVPIKPGTEITQTYEW